MIFKKNKSTFITALLMMVIFLIGCEDNNNGKIPITTSSEEALSNFLKGRNLSERFKRQEAIQYFEKAVELDPKFAQAYFYLAISGPTIDEMLKRLDKAKSLMDDVSKGEKLLILYLEANLNNDQVKEKQTLDQMVLEYPNDERAYLLLGEYYYKLQEYNTAISCFNSSIKINKDFEQVYNMLGYTYRYLENFMAAEKAFKKYISLNPDDPNPYDSYGELLMKMGEYEASMDQYENAISHDSNYVASYIGIATNLMFTGHYKEAREKLDEILSKTRNDAEKRAIYYTCAITYADEGKYENTIKELTKIQHLADTKNDIAVIGNSMINISSVYFELENYDQAEHYFDMANELVQNSNLSDEIKQNTALAKIFVESLLLSKKGYFAEAKEKASLYLSGAENSGNKTNIWTSHELSGRIALDQKNYKEATDELIQANLQNPYNLYRLALAYYGLGDKGTAIKYLQKTVNFNALNSLFYAYCRNDAKKMLIDLQ